TDLISRLTGTDKQESADKDMITCRLLSMVETLSRAETKLDNADELFVIVSGLANLEVESCAVQLWNWVVAKKMGNQISEECNAKLRHSACKLICLIETSTLSPTTIQRQILMAMKTAHSWLDCKKFNLCEEFLDSAENDILGIFVLMYVSCVLPSFICVRELAIHLFKVHCLQAELAVSRGQHEKGSALFFRCRDMLLSLPQEVPSYLSMLCYNFGIETYEQKHFEESIFWLRQSYDTGKMNSKYSASSTHQAKSLRLLAKVYMDWDAIKYSEKALHALEIATTEEPHWEGLLLKVKILTRCKASETAILEAVEDLFKQDKPVTHALAALRSLLHDNRESLCSSCLERLSKHTQHSLEFGQILLFKLEFLLHFGHESLARQHVEDCITGHYTGRSLSDSVKKLFQAMIWEQAAKFYVQATDYATALQWYNCSASLYSPGSNDGNLGRLHRNRSICYQHMLQYEQAMEAAKEAQHCDPDSINTNFVIYQLTLSTGNIQTATEALSKMEMLSKSAENKDLCLEPNSLSELLELAAQLALEVGEQNKLAAKALEIFSSTSSDIKKNLHALKCLVRLRITPLCAHMHYCFYRIKDMVPMISYQQTALDKLKDCDGKLTVEERNADANWFKSIAWNFALDSENGPKNMETFFMLSYQLSRLCVEDVPQLLAQKTCLVMAAGAALQLGRESTGDEQLAQLTRVLEHTEACREVDARLRTEEVGQPQRDPSSALMRLYELEAKAKLCSLEGECSDRTSVASPRLEEALQSLFDLPDVEPHALETAAALLMDPPAHYLNLSKKALRFAFSMHLKRTPVNTETCSLYYPHLSNKLVSADLVVWMILLIPMLYMHHNVKNKLMCDRQQDGYPELQVLWLLTTAWNRGVAVLTYGRASKVAERWCSLAMRLLTHLTSLRSSYQQKV
uniref:Protein ZIP4 homolog n=1 Tax=Petromyzon marinus TaxID=7757 RepID=S4RWM6_PETMA